MEAIVDRLPPNNSLKQFTLLIPLAIVPYVSTMHCRWHHRASMGRGQQLSVKEA